MGNDDSKKDSSATLLTALVVVVIVGLLAALAIPAWLKIRAVRASSQDKAVLSNLRQLGTGADQYFIEHPGVTSVAYADIVGTNSSIYVKTFVAVAGERYNAVFISGQAITASGIAGARTVTFQ